MAPRSRPSLHPLWQALDETQFGSDRTLNLRGSLPSAAQARARAESWLRQRQVSGSGDVLVITGRGNQSVDGIGIIRATLRSLLLELRRKGVVERWRDHSAGSVVVTLAPMKALLDAPRRWRERRAEQAPDPITPEVLDALSPNSLDLLRQLALRNIEGLGVKDARPFMREEMLRVFEKLSAALPRDGDADRSLASALAAALEEIAD